VVQPPVAVIAAEACGGGREIPPVLRILADQVAGAVVPCGVEPVPAGGHSEHRFVVGVER
jgi:hypothetical protein